MYTNKIKINCHIELSNFCNAACPMCGRNNINSKPPYEMRIRKDVDNSQITISNFKKIFDTKFFNTFTLGYINMCGNRGDPITAKYLLEICEYLYEVSPNTTIKMATNGGLRSPAYWSKLGTVFKKMSNNSCVTWGIDGLEDTNHIYRQRVNFKKVMNNAQAFIDAGGKSRWQFLIFKHNEHQLDEAYTLSKKMGFDNFITIHTPRFAHSQKGDGIKRFSFKNKNFKLETADPSFSNKQKAMEFIIGDKQEGVNCKASDKNEFYIDNKGRVIPCCWLGNSLDKMEGDNPNNMRDKIMHFFDIEEMNIIKNDLTDTLLNNTFINNIVPMAWNNLGKDCASDTCKTFCSKKNNLRKEHVEYNRQKM